MLLPCHGSLSFPPWEIKQHIWPIHEWKRNEKQVRHIYTQRPKEKLLSVWNARHSVGIKWWWWFLFTVSIYTALQSVQRTLYLLICTCQKPGKTQARVEINPILQMGNQNCPELPTEQFLPSYLDCFFSVWSPSLHTVVTAYSSFLLALHMETVLNLSFALLK